VCLPKVVEQVASVAQITLKIALALENIREANTAPVCPRYILCFDFRPIYSRALFHSHTVFIFVFHTLIALNFSLISSSTKTDSILRIFYAGIFIRVIPENIFSLIYLF